MISMIMEKMHQLLLIEEGFDDENQKYISNVHK